MRGQFVQEGGAGAELTTVGVRRSSCRPSPPRITVLLVSIMTTLESRKPMLLIVLSVVVDYSDAFDGFQRGVRVGVATHGLTLTTDDLGAETFGPVRGASRVGLKVVHYGMEVATSLIAPHTPRDTIFFWYSNAHLYTRDGIFSRLWPDYRHFGSLSMFF